MPPALTGRPWKWRTALARRSVSLLARWHIQTDTSLRANDSSLLLEMIEAHHRDLYQSGDVCVRLCVRACLHRRIRWEVKTRGTRTASGFLTWICGEKGPCFELRGNQTAQTSNPLLRSTTSVFFLAVLGVLFRSWSHELDLSFFSKLYLPNRGNYNQITCSLAQIQTPLLCWCVHI